MAQQGGWAGILPLLETRLQKGHERRLSALLLKGSPPTGGKVAVETGQARWYTVAMKLSAQRREFLLNLFAGVIIVHYAAFWANILLRTGAGALEILYNFILIVVFLVVAIKISKT